MNDLAKRVVACSSFRWMPGMLSQSVQRVVVEMPDSDGEQHIVARPYHPGGAHKLSPQVLQVRVDLAGELPVLEDHATIGCLLSLVREAWCEPAIVATCLASDAYGEAQRWCVRVLGYDLPADADMRGNSEAEALVAALEAAGVSDE